MVPTLVGGTFFRRSRVSRYVHSYNHDGTVAAAMQEKPRDLFERVFGRIDLAESKDARRQRLKRSVLDTVVDQYKFYTGKESPLGAASRKDCRSSGPHPRVRAAGLCDEREAPQLAAAPAGIPITSRWQGGSRWNGNRHHA